MSGKTTFNRDLFEAEVLSFGDEVCSTHMTARRNFGGRLKQLTAIAGHRCEGKNNNALELRPFWRVTMSLNSEPENICVLPPLDDGVGDKLILLKANFHGLFDTPNWAGGRLENWNRLQAELPGFLAHLLSFEIPAGLRCHRYGIKSYHHPEILSALGALSSEQRLLELIDTSIFRTADAECETKLRLPQKLKPWQGKAADLERQLLNDSEVAHQVKRLFSWDGAAGTFMSRLSKYSDRVSKRTVDGYAIYAINPPKITSTNE